MSKVRIPCHPTQSLRWRALLVSWTPYLLPVPLLALLVVVLFTTNLTAALVCLFLIPVVYVRFLGASLAILREPGLEYTLVLSEQGIGVLKGADSTHQEWKAIHKVIQLADAWVVVFRNRREVLIPGGELKREAMDLLVEHAGHRMDPPRCTSAEKLEQLARRPDKGRRRHRIDLEVEQKPGKGASSGS